MAQITLIILTLWLSIIPAWGVSDHQADATRLFRELRCPVCQGESLLEAQNSVAEDIRHYVLQALETGASIETIRAHIISRYGESILMTPPLTSHPLLWAVPWGTIVGMGGIIWFVQRRNRR